MRTRTSAKLPALAGVGGVGNTSHRTALRPCVQHRVPSYRQNLSLCYPSRCRTMSISAASTATAPSAQAAARSDLQQGSASMEVAIQELQQLCQDALKTLGYDDQQSLTISEVSSCACSGYQAQDACLYLSLFLLCRCCYMLNCATTATIWSKSSLAVWTSCQMKNHLRRISKPTSLLLWTAITQLALS